MFHIVILSPRQARRGNQGMRLSGMSEIKRRTYDGSIPSIPTMITNLKLQIIAVRLELGYSLSDKQKEVWDNASQLPTS